MKWVEAVLKSLFGTDTGCENFSSQEGSMREFGDIFQASDPKVESARRFEQTTVNIEKMEQSLSRLSAPAASLDDAIKQMLERR